MAAGLGSPAAPGDEQDAIRGTTTDRPEIEPDHPRSWVPYGTIIRLERDQENGLRFGVHVKRARVQMNRLCGCFIRGRVQMPTHGIAQNWIPRIR